MKSLTYSSFCTELAIASTFDLQDFKSFRTRVARMIPFITTLTAFALLGLPFVSADTPSHIVNSLEQASEPIFEVTFHENHQKNFSWSDPELQKLLWEGGVTNSESHLEKRAPIPGIPRVFGPAVKVLSCIGCAKLPAGKLLDYWSTQKFLDDILVTAEETRDKCIFYGRRREDNMFPSGLSDIANLFACNSRKITIWYMWPRGQTNPGINEGPLDYYAMFQKGSHLEPIYKAGYKTTYFENMSRAMAMTCMGNIWVMSDVPENFVSGKTSGGIWWDVEFPTLGRRQSDLGTLTAVSTFDFSIGYDVNWADGKSGGRVVLPREISDALRDAYEAENGGNYLSKRDSCSIAGQYEPPGEDFFG